MSNPERSTSPICVCPNPKCRTFLPITSGPDAKPAGEGAEMTCDVCGEEFKLSQELVVRRAAI